MKTLAQTEKGPIEYHLVGQDGPTVLVLNGGHTNCDSPLGYQQFFVDQGKKHFHPHKFIFRQTYG